MEANIIPAHALQHCTVGNMLLIKALIGHSETPYNHTATELWSLVCLEQSL